jgi:hypothetical protein
MSDIYSDEEIRKMKIDEEEKAEQDRENIVKNIKDIIGDMDWDNLNGRQLLHIVHSLREVNDERWEEFWNKEWE